ncbi:MAG: LuxR C-terminal-related transcriptional regulator [Rhodobacteraceae bacterium]|nr:LuxR C-terminal-related transcriptional regulator [Paracoccaceae bacterium]
MSGFIETKFEIPVLLPRLVARGALISQLDRVLEGRLAVISAPAGFGKTTLLGQWCQTAINRGMDVAWLSLGEGENEPGRLLDHVIRALGRVSEQLVANLPAIVEASPTLPVDVILTRLINGVAAWKRDIVLAIDDAHFLTNPEVGAILDALLAYAPPNLRVLLATRGAVPVKVATLRMRGLMVRLDEAALRFSLEEAVSFLNGCRGLSLAEADILALQNRTEGWIAALQLASLALTEIGSANRARFLHQFSGASGDIADFLMQDVIGRLPSEILDFLLRTSILDWFDADLAEALSGQADAEARLKDIEGANLFLVPLDPERTLYRYHHLFADLLRTLLRQRHAGDLASLHRTAARRLAARALPADAVHHALAAGDTEEAAALVEACCMPLIRQSHLSRVQEWLARLPDVVIQNRPRLLLAKVWIEFQISRPRSAAAALRRARDSLAAARREGRLDPIEDRALAAELSVLTAGVFSSAERSRSAVRLAEARWSSIPEDLPFLRGTLGNILAYSLYSLGDYGRARQACLIARDSHAEAQSVFGVVYSDLILGLIEKGAGNLGLADEHFSRATRRAEETLGPGSYAEAMAGIFRVELHYEWNELAEAEALLTRHRPLIEECGLVVHDIACKLHVARLAAARSQIDEALAVLERAERQGVKSRYRRLSATALNDRVRLLVLRGETTLARYVLAARGISEDWARRPEARRQACELEHVALARLLIAENRPEAAIRLLDPLAERVRHEGRLRRLAQIRAVTAIAAYRTGDGLATLAAIVDAVEICRRQGALRALIDEGEPLRDVLLFGREKVPSWRSRSEVAAYLDRVIGTGPMPDATERRRIKTRPRFSPKESDVARMLMGGMSNRDLAASLDMASDTVKWHLKNIFSKLGVENRTQAVLRLREMDFS